MIASVSYFLVQQRKEVAIVTTNTAIQFHMGTDDRHRLEGLPWHFPLEEWQDQGVSLLIIRRGESRHPVVFVERQGIRYAIKETTPHMAEREIYNLRETERRGIPTLSPIGSVSVSAPPIPIEVPELGGARQYMSGDRGYTVTRLAPRVIPQVILYRLPFTRRTKHRLLSAVAVLMIELHEHGVYWGDPSLANVLMRIDGRRVLAIMADAETSELFPGPVSEGLREQDIELFGESLAWQAEDLRQARGLPESKNVLDDADFRYFKRRYNWLRREHARVAAIPHLSTLYEIQQFLHRLNEWGFSLLGTTGHALQEFATVLPGWYQQRIDQLLGIKVPRIYARRFYNMILGHQALMSQHEGRDVSIEEAARDWYTHYHLPAILLLRRCLTKGQDPMQAYFAVMQHKWQMSKKAGYEVPLDEAIVDWSMQQAETGNLGAVDPALMAKWWRELEPTTEVLEPPLIESGALEPLVSPNEKPLVHLPQPELEQKLPEILEDGDDEE
jgi:uncharacterized protein DUF4032